MNLEPITADELFERFASERVKLRCPRGHHIGSVYKRLVAPGNLYVWFFASHRTAERDNGWAEEPKAWPVDYYARTPQAFTCNCRHDGNCIFDVKALQAKIIAAERDRSGDGLQTLKGRAI